MSASVGARRRTVRFFTALAFTTLVSGSARAQLFRSPVSCSNCINYFYYLDEGQTRDWNCGSATYEGHDGTDYSLRNGNSAIANNNEVVAMADGVVVHTEDGYYDRCTQCGGTNCGLDFGNGFANQVIINHGSYRTIYGHMKQGSVAVRQGDGVKCGQVIGFIGSSGCSSGAHLHIEPSRVGQTRYMPIDPYVGDCSPSKASLFVDQVGYRMMPSTTCENTTTTQCPAGVSETWTCSEDRTLRRRCVNGAVSEERCSAGCTSMAAGADAVCTLPPDADGDGSRADTDCDDARVSVHPGAVETCGDGVDQDCSGSDLACGAGGSGGASSVAGGGGQPAGGSAGAASSAGAGGFAMAGGGGANQAGGTIAAGGTTTVGGFGGSASTSGGGVSTSGGSVSTSGGSASTSGGSASGSTSSAGAGGVGTAAGNGAAGGDLPPANEAGCSCRTTPSSSSPPATASLLLVACTALLRRRKRHPARVAARCSISPSTNTRTLGGMRRALG